MSGEQRTSPFYTIPPHHIASVEHPAIIRNVDKAIDTLEGNVGISKVPLPSQYGIEVAS
jgi:general transcription factor 3C polypeptide 5 (transcription factor C subunit 1)